MKKDRNKFKCKDNELKLRAITRLIEEYEKGYVKGLRRGRKQTLKEERSKVVEWAKDNNFIGTYRNFGNEQIETRCIDYEEFLNSLKNK